MVVPLYVTSYSEPPGCLLSVSWSLFILRVMVTAAPSVRLIYDNACLVAAVTMPSLLAMSSTTSGGRLTGGVDGDPPVSCESDEMPIPPIQPLHQCRPADETRWQPGILMPY